MKHTDIPEVKTRRPLGYGLGQYFYMESDNDFLEKNHGAAVWFLEHASELRKIVKMFNEANVT